MSALSGLLVRHIHLSGDATKVLGGAVQDIGLLLGIYGFHLFYSKHAAPAGGRPPVSSIIKSGAATFFIAILLVDATILVWGFLLTKLGLPMANQEFVDIAQSTGSGWLKVSLMAIAVILAPATEEIVFRGRPVPVFPDADAPLGGDRATSFLFGALHVSWDSSLSGLPSFAPMVVLADDLLPRLRANGLPRNGHRRPRPFQHLHVRPGRGRAALMKPLRLYSRTLRGSVSSLGEEALIRSIRRWLGAASPKSPAGIGDDCAVLRPARGRELLTVDPLIHGVHFDDQVPARAAGAKLFKRNLSDIAAMGGRPRGGPGGAGSRRTRVDRMARRVLPRACPRRAAATACPIVGGDVARLGGAFVATLALTGEARGRVLTRTGSRPGDWIYVTGSLGNSLASGHHFQFQPRLAEGAWLARRKEVRAMIDVSDGLAKDVRALTPPGRRRGPLRRHAPASPGRRHSRGTVRRRGLRAALQRGRGRQARRPSSNPGAGAFPQHAPFVHRHVRALRRRAAGRPQARGLPWLRPSRLGCAKA